MQAELTLALAVKALDAIERARISAIHIEPSNGGYLARISLAMMLPQAESAALPGGIDMRGFTRSPDIERSLTWRIPAWDQVLEVVHDAQLSSPENLGNMAAVEVCHRPETPEAERHWIISTPGAPKSCERLAWMRSTEAR